MTFTTDVSPMIQSPVYGTWHAGLKNKTKQNLTIRERMIDVSHKNVAF